MNLAVLTLARFMHGMEHICERAPTDYRGALAGNAVAVVG